MKQTPLNVYPRTPPGWTTVPPQALVAKFGTNLISFKLYILETRVKINPTLKFTPDTPWADYSATTGPGGQIWN